eukprot:6927-Chlamydomonas_euryale.AAC.1
MPSDGGIHGGGGGGGGGGDDGRGAGTKLHHQLAAGSPDFASFEIAWRLADPLPPSSPRARSLAGGCGA